MIFSKLQSNFAEISISHGDILTKTSSSSYRFIGGAGLGDAELVVGDDPEVVGGLRVEVLVADGVVLHGAATRPDLSLPFIHV